MTRPAPVTTERDWTELVQSLDDVRAGVDGFLAYLDENLPDAGLDDNTDADLDEFPDADLDALPDPDPDAETPAGLTADDGPSEGGIMQPDDEELLRRLDDEALLYDETRHRDDLDADGRLDGDDELEPGE